MLRSMFSHCILLLLQIVFFIFDSIYVYRSDVLFFLFQIYQHDFKLIIWLNQLDNVRKKSKNYTEKNYSRKILIYLYGYSSNFQCLKWFHKIARAMNRDSRFCLECNACLKLWRITEAIFTKFQKYFPNMMIIKKVKYCQVISKIDSYRTIWFWFWNSLWSLSGAQHIIDELLNNDDPNPITQINWFQILIKSSLALKFFGVRIILFCNRTSERV